MHGAERPQKGAGDAVSEWNCAEWEDRLVASEHCYNTRGTLCSVLLFCSVLDGCDYGPVADALAPDETT